MVGYLTPGAPVDTFPQSELYNDYKKFSILYLYPFAEDKLCYEKIQFY